MRERWRGLRYHLTQVHWPIFILVTLLSLFGIAMMVSAGGGSMSPWADRQLLRGVFGIGVMLGVALVPASFWLRYAYIFFGVGVCMLLVVEAMGFLGKGAQRWVQLGGVNLQPSELMKFCVILALARFYHYAPPGTTNRPLRLAMALGIIMIPAVLIFLQPNLGTATILTLVGVSLVFTMGLSWKLIIAVAVAGLSSLPLAWNYLLHDYQKRRVLTFLNPEQDPLGAGYNILQSMIAIGSGGFTGKGFLQGSQGQLDFLPEKHTDFIFTMVGEELGFIGGVLLLLSYLLLILLALGVGIRARSIFCSLVATGVATMLFVHLAINVAMVMGLIPVVGVPLPLISYGGSVQMATLLGCGLLLNASVYREFLLKKSSM
jgi:rod shape determining protein RodA